MKTIHWVILLLLSISVSSCFPDKRYNVTETDRTMIPYHIGDTVRFVNESGNYIHLVVTNETSWWNHYDEYLYDEHQRVILESIHNNYKLWIDIHGWNDPNRRDLSFWLYRPNSGAGAKVYYDSKGNLLSSEDSAFIGGNWYYNVANGNTQVVDGPAQGFYNKTHGVLQIMKNGKNIFTLDTIIFANKR